MKFHLPPPYQQTMDNETAKSLYDRKDADGRPWFYGIPDTKPQAWINFVKRTVIDYEKIKGAGQATAAEFNDYRTSALQWIALKIETPSNPQAPST